MLSQLFTIALSCGVAIAAPIPQTSAGSSSPAVTTSLGGVPNMGDTSVFEDPAEHRRSAEPQTMSGTSSAASAGSRGPILNMGDTSYLDSATDWPSDSTVPESPPPTYDQGYNLVVMKTEVFPEGTGHRQHVNMQFIDNTAGDVKQGSAPTAVCDLDILEKDLKPSLQYTCTSDDSWIAMHEQTGPLRNDGSAGSAKTFKIEIYGGPNHNKRYFVDFVPSLWDDPKSHCEGDANDKAKPLVCTLQLQSQQGVLFQESTS